MSELLLLINIDDNDKKLDIEDIEQSLTNDFQSIGEVKKVDISQQRKLMTQLESLLDTIEGFSTKISDINRFKEEVNKDKWDYLCTYYFEPLIYEFNQISDTYCDIED